MTNMVVGPALEIGGNVVEMTNKGKVQVTNAKGNIKTLSQDEFKKNLVKNADKINLGEDFEFKKDHKALKIAAAAIGTAAVTTAVIYRKEIGKYLKNFSFKKAWNDVKDFFTRKSKKMREQKRTATYSKIEAQNDAHRYFAQNADTINLTEAERSQKVFDSLQAYSAPSFNPEKGWEARTKLLANAKVSEDQLSVMHKLARLEKGQKLNKEEMALMASLPKEFKTKKACSKFIKEVRNAMIEASK